MTIRFVDEEGREYIPAGDVTLVLKPVQVETPPQPETPTPPPEDPPVMPPPLSNPPGRPQDVRVVRNGPMAELLWSPSSSGGAVKTWRAGRDGFDRNGQGPWETELSGPHTSLRFFGLVEAKSYNLWVEPVNDDGTGERVTVICPTYQAPTPPPETPTPTPPPVVTPPPPSSDGPMTVERLVYLSWGDHEAAALGLNPGWDWANHGRGGRELAGHALSPWGQIFAVPGTPTYNVSVQQRNVRMLFLRKNGTWYEPLKLANPAPEGAFWDKTFNGIGKASVQKNGDVWETPLDRLAEQAVVTFHWWWKGFYPRVPVPSDVIGCFAAGEMRLVGSNATRAKMIGSISADVYDGPTTVRTGEQIAAMSQPRMAYVTDEWQWFGGVSYPKGSSDKPITKAMLLDNPPTGVVK